MRLAWRLAVSGWMLCWLVGVPWLYRGLPAQMARQPIRGDFFPSFFFADPRAAFLLWLFPAVSGVTAMIVTRRRTCTLHAVTVIACAGLLMCHQLSFYLVGTVTSFWSGWWLFWAAQNVDPPLDSAVIRRGEFLSLVILSVIYLGPAINKWTPGYWSGEAFRQFGIPEREWIADLVGVTLYSRLVIVIETLLGFCWLIPSRIALPLCMAIVLLQWYGGADRGIGWLTINAIGPIVGIAAAGFSLTLRAERSRAGGVDRVS